MVVLILLVLSVSGCERGVDAPEAGSISGRVVLTEDHAQGLTGVSLFILDGTGSYVEQMRVGTLRPLLLAAL